MSLYNLMNGVNQATFYVLPMLGKHPDEYPRFRDCFVKMQDTQSGMPEIHVYTRVGGNNRNEGFGEEELYESPHFLSTWDDEFDNTYATYAFKVPEEWQSDFDNLTQGNVELLSVEYQHQLRKVYPKLNDKFDEIWPPEEKSKDDWPEGVDHDEALPM